MTFPVNTTITLTRADWLCRFIRKNGVGMAVSNSSVIGESHQHMTDFIDRNFEALFPGPSRPLPFASIRASRSAD